MIKKCIYPNTKRVKVEEKFECELTEKLDGSNISMSANGVCERSTATETRKPWTRNLWDPQEGLYWKIRDYIGPDETIYGERGAIQE